jgi:thiamine pyrophosphokinase
MKDIDLRNPFKYDAVVLADGEQPEHDIPVRLLQEAPYVVCCDGAIRYCDWADAVVGDGDSIPSWAREEYECILHQEDEQDDNDLTKATRFCLQKGFRRIVYLGATGMREDHTLGNISLMMRYAREFGIAPLMATNYGWFVPAIAPSVSPSGSSPAPSQLRSTTFASFPGQQVSIINFNCKTLQTEGLKYDGYPFTQWWQGTLNEATADHFRIMADGDYLLFRTYANHREA